MAFSTTNFTASQIGDTNQVALSWDAVTLVTGYILERDTNPIFPAPEIYTTTSTSYTDTITEVATYYYRVRAVNDPLAIQSLWSDSQIIEISLVTDFEGIPLVGLQPLSVQFTDLSTPIGAVTAWDWDFGDGAQSVERNPAHFYANPGFYTVTLTITGDSGTFVVRKENYIRVTGKYTYDIAPDPDKEAYLSGIGMVFLRNVGVELRRVKA